MKIKFFFEMQLLILLSSFFASARSADPLKELFSGTTWEFMEERLVIKPKEFLEKNITVVSKIFSSITIGLIAGTGIKLCATRIFALMNLSTRKENNNALHQSDWRYEEDSESFAQNSINLPINFATISTEVLCAMGAMFLTAFFSYKIIDCHLKNSADYTAFEQFIEEWPENKHLTPKRFHKAYDALFDLYSKEVTFKKFKKIAPEALAKTRLLIFQQFQEKYKHVIESRENTGGASGSAFIFNFKPLINMFSKLFGTVAK